MRGVYRNKNGYWIAKYGSEYIGSFKERINAEHARKEYESVYGIPTKSHPKNDLTGRVFGNLKVLGYTGNTNNWRNRKVLVENLITNEAYEVLSSSLTNGAANGKKQWENSKKILGVRLRKDTGKWTAEIMINKKKYYLGSFRTQEEAIEARLAAEEKYFKPILEKYEKENPDE